jgi:hypothetical protein
VLRPGAGRGISRAPPEDAPRAARQGHSPESSVRESRIYKVIFRNHDRLFEVYASNVDQGSLFGFVEVEELLFGEKSQVVVDPSEESIKVEFKGVKRTFIPLHAIIRIDEVEKQGTSRVSAASGESNVTVFPAPIPPARPEPKR